MLLSQHLKMKIIIVLIIATLATGSWAVGECSKDRCTLYNALKNAKIGDDVLSNLMCIADYSSGFNVLFKKNPQYSGIFQINEQDWCQGEKCGNKNLCNMPCAQLQDSNLTDDIQCALKIYKTQGLKAWGVWVPNCQNKDLRPYLQGC